MNLQDIDYEALAKQHGAISSMPATAPGKNGEIDYEAIAKQHGAIGSTPAPQAASASSSNEFDPAKAAANPIGYGYERAGHAVVNFGKNLITTLGSMLPNVAPTPTDILTGSANTVAGGIESFEKAKAEGQAAREAPTTTAAIPHRIGQAGYTAAGLLAPVGGKALEGAGEQFGKGDISGGLGTTTGLLTPIGAAHLTPRVTGPPPAAEVTPVHVEALTGLIEDRGGTVDPHETATAALPTLRETAVRMKVDPSTLKGREAGQTTLRVAEQAVRDTQNEFNDIRKPYNSVLVDQKPIAQAYRDAITPELLANEPKVARTLERTAQKFDQPAPLDQVNQFRIRMNNQLNAFEQRGTTAQIMSDIETKAQKAATNAARDIEYNTVGRLSGLDPEYIRSLKQREGSLIEAKSSLTKEYNRASGAQGEVVSKGVREKVANTYPSPRGVKHAGIRELIGPKPIEVLNNRIQKMFAGMGAAGELPSYEQVQPPAAPQIEGGSSGPLPGGESLVDELTRGGPGSPPPAAPDTSQTFSRGGKMGTPQGIADQVNAAKTGSTANATARVDAHKVAKAAIGEQVQAPVAPVAGGQITPEHVASENAFYTQARAELGADASPSAVLQRAQALKIEHAAKSAPPPVTPVTPTMRQTLTQKMQARPLPTLRRVTPPTAPGSTATASPRQQATALMLLVKQGKLSPAEADSKIQRLVGPGGRRIIRRPVGPE